jgi:pyridine nucleotide-disulfide oxidoreductase family protein
MSRHLLLVGAGHAHVLVLEHLADRPLQGVQVTLVSPSPWQPYSGMLPGLLTGQYRPDQCLIDVRPLAQRAGVRFMEGRVCGIDAAEHLVQLTDGGTVGYDLLSLDVGSDVNHQSLRALGSRLLPIKPLEAFHDRWQQVLEGLAGTAPYRLAVVGGGAAGVEAALAASVAWRQRGLPLSCALITGPRGVLPEHSAGVRRRVLAALRAHHINCLPVRAQGTPHGLLLDNGQHHEADLVLAATGAVAPDWLRDTPLSLDAQGFVAVNEHHQSVSHPNVFAVGDVCSRVDQPVARSGVHAVRVGPVLAHNLGAWLSGQPLRAYRPRRWSLYLLSIGCRQAVLSWGPFSAAGAWVWRLKDHIDRGFMARFGTPTVTPPSPSSPASGPHA